MPGKRYTNKAIIEKLDVIIKENEKSKIFSISMTGIPFIAIAISAMFYLDMFDKFVTGLIAFIYFIFGVCLILFSEQIVKFHNEIKKNKDKRK